ncbi:MAG TPA: hypothetical protein P5567_09630 [Kiritimatiellia bacterium]|nr:hypothetical protein [Candidatus Brocadiia bacterium]HRZ12700.1 hypothetical protein [Kiritimatiellia bacterium]HSA18348.1 hypothetical protein [Kiritimatiellia bacterium]
MCIAPQQFNIVGLSLNIIGSVIIAISLGSFFKWVNLALGANDMANSGGPVVTGASRHVDRAHRLGSGWTWLGVVLLILGFVCQLIAAIKA